MSIAALARPEILALRGYSSARMEAAPAAVMLNANESPWAPPGAAGAGLNRYPEPQPAALRRALAGLYRVAEEQVLVGRGSDEAIDLLLRVFCRPGRDAIVTVPPTFGMYRVAADIQGVATIEVPLASDFTLDAEAVLAACDARVRLVFLCSPNNPTGGLVPWPVIAALAARLDGRALVVVDEAYVEFAGVASAAAHLAEHPNLAVLRTLSKAWALAGARIGSLLAAPEVIGLCRRVMAPYPLPTPSVAAALAALAEPELMAARVATVCAARVALAAQLARLPSVRAVLPSAANFLCVRFADVALALRQLAARGVVVRDVSRQPALANCLRISVGTEVENASVVAALEAAA